MSKLALVGFVIALGGCGGGGTNNPPPVDTPAGTVCTNADYDPCTVNTECSSNNCHFFMQSAFTVCSPACSASTPCPVDSTGVAPPCNMMGICKPAAANNCTR